MPSIGHGHSSRLASVPASQLGAEVAKGTADPSINVITFTEVGNSERAAALKSPGWSKYQGSGSAGKGECAVMFKLSGWSKIFGEAHMLTDKPFYTGKGKKHAPIYVCSLVLDRTDCKSRLWISVAHLPSSVEGSGGFAKDQDKRVAAWKDAVQEWHRYQNKVIRPKWKPDVELVVADWNLDHKLGWVRDYIGNVWPSQYNRWRKPYPDKGTFKKRLIDATWASSNAGNGSKVLTSYSGVSDHRPFTDFYPL